jgi:Protein of unknown function (DUF3551)
MRTIVLLAIGGAGMALTATSADAGPWCGTFRLGSTSCGYSSSEECTATVRGLGGFCYPNPYPGTAFGTSAGSWNARDAPRRPRRAY